MEILFKSNLSFSRGDRDGVRDRSVFAPFVGLVRQASCFLLRSLKKATKEKAALSRFILCRSDSWAAIELTLTSHKKHGLLRSSNMRLPESPTNLALLGAVGRGWMKLSGRRDEHLINDGYVD
jgi:hypothetical protein